MQLAKRKLDVIGQAWNSYFLEYQFCQKHINYSEEVATNYFGDVVSYLDDTFPIISREQFLDGRKNHLSSAMALLQAIFVQQDLVDELLVIFGLPKSNNDFKKTNRDLRNHLIGHPVSRSKDGKLVSTVFLRYDNPDEEIVYVLYETVNGFRGDMKHVSIDSIISDHTRYLHRNFDIVLKKIRTILYLQRKELKRMLASLDKKTKFAILVEDVFTYFEEFTEWDFTYKKERLREYYERRKEHRRYAYVITLFRKDLRTSLTERITDIGAYGKEITLPPPFDPTTVPEIKFISVTAETFKGKRRKYKKSMSYEFSKLQQKDHPLGLNYLLERFGDRPLVGDELRHMQANRYNDTEYYASYHYVKKLLRGIKSRMFYE